ncbi:hypothetical protein [Sebaldella sp. S0638]|uniref:LiaF transmembrane domain-containing protein n=1 Tax=Sebaldella sp. S0638 TaxID=2957809 RepID=UPI0020A0C3F3|nr:hypothetical protein [Sebaldella sp. S0638]MCP1223339.1 hypothetical protein [Sebaldella sp. S0638]
MGKKIFFGIGLILLGILYGLQVFGMINGDTIKYILNYQIILILVGVFVGIAKKKTSGWIITGVGVYLYIKEFFEGFTNIGITAGLLIVGTAITVSGIMDRRNKNEKANENVNISIKSSNISKDAEDIEEEDDTKEETWEK